MFIPENISNCNNSFQNKDMYDFFLKLCTFKLVNSIFFSAFCKQKDVLHTVP